jgi:hypothetical protein
VNGALELCASRGVVVVLVVVVFVFWLSIASCRWRNNGVAVFCKFQIEAMMN